MEEILFQLGLDVKEAALFIALLEEGPATVSNIAKAANIDRSSAYSILGRLVSKGFAGFVVENDVRKYSATDPEKLLDVLEEKKALLFSSLPTLKALRKRAGAEIPRVTVYSGVEGFKTVMNDLLRHGKNILGFGYTGAGPEIARSWYESWQRMRIKNRVWRYYIAPRKSATTEAGKAPLTKMKIISNELVTPASTLIYGERVLIFFPGKGGFAGIVIENKEMADSYRHFFWALWKKL